MSLDSYYASFDGGASAQALPSLNGKPVRAIATSQGISYAIFWGGNADVLAVSRDKMRSWQGVSVASQLAPEQLWLDPASGMAIAQFGTDIGSGSTQQHTTIYTTGDSGKTWNQMQGQGMAQQGTFLEAPPEPSSANSPAWTLCNVSDNSTDVPTTILTCSHDQGRTWQKRASWTTSGPAANTIVLTPSGALYGVGTISPNVTQATNGMVLYELAPGATGWVQRGAAPQYGLAYDPSTGMLWAEPVTMMGGPDPFAVFSAHVG